MGCLVRCVKGEGSAEDSKYICSLGIDVAKFHFNHGGVLFFADTRFGGGEKRVVHRLVVPAKYVKLLLREHHDNVQGSHLGSDKLIYVLSGSYYWATMNRDIVDYVQSCERCQQFKLGRAIGRVPVGNVAEPEWNELIVMDICGPLKKTSSGVSFILCIIEYSTRFVRFVPLVDCTAKSTARAFFDCWLCVFGPPTAVNSDRGPAFISLLMRELCEFYNIQRKLSCPYVPRSHGIVERVQLTLQKALGFYLDSFRDEWDIPLQAVAHAMNSTPSRSTGFSPNFLMFGREVGRVVDGIMSVPPHSRRSLREQLQDLMTTTEACRMIAKKCSELQREKYRGTANRFARIREFEIGQKVFIFIPKVKKGFSKCMSQVWHGPYTVTARLDEMNYKVRLDQTGREIPMRMHVIRMKAAVIRGIWHDPELDRDQNELVTRELVEEDLPDDSFESEDCVGLADLGSLENNEPDYYEIEKIVQGKHFEGGIKYLCKWKGYDKRYNSYEPYENLNDMAREYLRRSTIRIVGKPVAANTC